MKKDTLIASEIEAIRKQLGDKLCIVGHHYQAQEVVNHCDILGDSLELARKIIDISARYVIFCGVYFMGESAALLAREGQSIYLPAKDAECVMAKTAPFELVERVFSILTKTGRKITPVAYVNSSLAVKSVVGKFGGIVCTSANAEKIVRWALEQGRAVIFLPDRNLGTNIAKKIGISSSEIHTLDISKNGNNVDLKAASQARMILWPGGCAIHELIHPSHIEQARKAVPNCLVIAHPECVPEVIDKCDESGSTTTLIRVVRNAKPNTTIYVGTEWNLVHRLAEEAAQRKVYVRPLRICTCSNMARVTPLALLDTLRKISEGTELPVTIQQNMKENAKASLQRMLDVCR